MPKVSVIMGVYNTPEEYISTAIESILNQTFADFEFIICNDCCTDNTFNFIKNKYLDNRIVWIENDVNKGLAYTLNHCLSVSRGEYIARMDSDDYSLPIRFEKQVEVLDTYKEISVVNCNINVFDDKGIYGERINNEYIEKKDFLLRNPIIHPSVMVRKQAYDLVNNYRDIDITYRNEDYDLFMRMISRGIKMYTIQNKLFNFREDKNSFKRRKYKYRINEYLVKFENFKKLNLLPKYYIFCLKPLIVGLIPVFILRKLKNKQ